MTGGGAPPRLQLVAVVDVQVADPIVVGHGPAGERRLVPILGGRVHGPRLCGTVEPGGADFQVERHDGVIEVEARYLLRLDDGALVYVNNRGLRWTAPSDTSGDQPASAVYFRTTPTFETGSEQYDWLHRHLFVAVGERFPRSVNLRVFDF